MAHQLSPPPSSSDTLFIHEEPTTATGKSSQRQHRHHDGSESPTPKRQRRSPKSHLEQHEAAHVFPDSVDAVGARAEQETQSSHQPDSPQAAPTPPKPPAQGQISSSGPHVAAKGSARGAAKAKALARAAAFGSSAKPPAAHHEQARSALMALPADHSQPRQGLPQSPPVASPQYPGNWTSPGSNHGFLTHHQGSWMNSAPAPPAFTRPQQRMQWYPVQSVSGPGYGPFMSNHNPPQSEPYALGYDVSNPAFQVFGYPPPPALPPSLGTASCPIIVGDETASFTTGLFMGAQQPPLQIPAVYSAHHTPFSNEGREAAARSRFVEHAPLVPQPGITTQPPRPLLVDNSLVNCQHPIGPASFSSPSMYGPIQTVSNPHGYLNSGPDMLSGMPPQPYNFIPNVPPRSIDQNSAKKGSLVPTDEPPLCPEQAALVDLILKGHNVFYTGSAGCGKSTVLRALVAKLKEQGKEVRIVAPTGRAALNVGGSTTWTFAGWTPDSLKKSLKQLRDAAFFGNMVKKRLTETDVLVIDEISMVENQHFERLNEIMKSARHQPHVEPRPFGGCQIIVTGDFCQLPPVKPFQYCIECGRELKQKTGPDANVVYECKQHGQWADEDKWAFRSKAWEECDFKHVHLKKIHRQNDQTFIRMLQKCRLGARLSEQEITLLMDHKCRVSQATKLYCTRKEADDVNRAAFDQIKAETHSYWAHDNFFWRRERHPHFQWKGVRSDWRNAWDVSVPKDKKPLKELAVHRFNECVQLKRGGLVVLLANLNLQAGLCNGSQGMVVGFVDYDPSMMPVRETRDEYTFGNKSKKESFVPKPGQRVLRGEYAGTQEQQISEFITSESVPIKKWPKVRFHNGVTCVVYAECSITQLGDEEPYSLLARTQLPLAPAWAMTVHKSQSLTLDRVIVDLSRAFEEGQVYVALSRATGLSGLKIEGGGQFLRDKLMVNAEVAAFLREKFGDVYGALEAETEEVDSGEVP